MIFTYSDVKNLLNSNLVRSKKRHAILQRTKD